jgi:hypothetical protein
MNRWKVAFFTSVAVSLCAVAYLIFEMAELGISYGYLQAGRDDLATSNRVLGQLVVSGGQDYSQKELLHLLRQEYPGAFIVEEGDTIRIGPNTFVFENDRLVSAK